MTVTAVARCLKLLEALANERETVELTQLAVKLDMPASAVHRLIITLVDHGWVIQDPVSQRYSLSLRMSTLAFRNLDARAVPAIVQTVLDNLARETREYCRLAIVEGEDLIWVARAQGATSGLRYDPDMGQEIVLHATANGKAWLATLPEDEAVRIAFARGFRSNRTLGPNSARTIDELRERLRAARKRGYGVSLEEAEQGTTALAVPFFASPRQDAPVAGTISVAGPTVRISPERYDSLVAALRRAAQEIAGIWAVQSRQRIDVQGAPGKSAV